MSVVVAGGWSATTEAVGRGSGGVDLDGVHLRVELLVDYLSLVLAPKGASLLDVIRHQRRVNSATTVIDTDPAVAPTITGTVAGQTTTSEAPVKPFSGVTIGDTKSGATDTLTITVGGTGGTLSGTGLSGDTGGGAQRAAIDHGLAGLDPGAPPASNGSRWSARRALRP